MTFMDDMNPAQPGGEGQEGAAPEMPGTPAEGTGEQPEGGDNA